MEPGTKLQGESRNEEQEQEPSYAPGMSMHDAIEEKATAEEIEQGEYTEVTRLFLDRTPED